MGILQRIKDQNGPNSTVRRIPTGLAPILTALEIDQPTIVSAEDIEELRIDRHLPASTRQITNRLQQEGWLLPLRTRGMYEFAPAARAGSFSSGSAHLELLATLRRRPDLPVAIAHESAAWMLGLSGRPPDREVIAAAKGIELPSALSEYRVVHQEPILHEEWINNLPVWKIESLLAMMAARPENFRDWENVHEWLGTAVTRLDRDGVALEFEGLSQAAKTRLAYLIESGGNVEFAETLLSVSGRPRGPVYLGSQRHLGKHDKKYNIINSLLTA